MSRVESNGLEHPPLQRLWRHDGPAILIAALATIALGCGVFIAGRCASVPADRAAMMALFTVTVWIAVAAAPLAAGAATRLGALCRGGIVADASVVTLIVLGIAGRGQLTWAAGVKIYLLWAPLAVTLALVVPLGRGRLVVAVAASIAAVAAMTSRFWAGGLLNALAAYPDALDRVTRALAAADVLGGVANAASSAKPFIWAEQPVMYHLTRLGQDYPSVPLTWSAPALTWWAAAAAMAAAIIVRRAVRRFRLGV